MTYVAAEVGLQAASQFEQTPKQKAGTSKTFSVA
jgi:hypothetical protein